MMKGLGRILLTLENTAATTTAAELVDTNIPDFVKTSHRLQPIPSIVMKVEKIVLTGTENGIETADLKVQDAIGMLPETHQEIAIVVHTTRSRVGSMMGVL
jgi:hypothetical protein